MEQSSGEWPHELENDDDLSFMYHHEMTSLDQFTANQIMGSLGQEPQINPLLSGTTHHASCLPFDSPASSQFNNAGVPGCCSSFVDMSNVGRSIAGAGAVPGEPVSVSPEVAKASSRLLSFGNLQDSLHEPAVQELYMNPAEAADHVEAQNEMRSLFSHGLNSNTTLDFQRVQQDMIKKSTGSRPASSAQDHVIAERKRRERLNQQFIALSTIIPGLKKTDKATLLGDAISYIRQLEENVKTLEEKASERTVESTILVKKFHLSTSTSKSDESPNSSSESFVPKITASLNGNSILLRIQCEKRKGLFVKVLSEIEKHRLSVINTNIMPFASSSLNITVTAQIEEGFSMTMKDLVKDIDSALSQAM